jgi:hypothetical protein
MSSADPFPKVCRARCRRTEEMTESPAIDASLAEAFEPHFKPRQLADRWGMSVTTVTNLFADEPGVVKIGGRSARKRTKVTLYIPLSVAQRVYATLRTQPN